MQIQRLFPYSLLFSFLLCVSSLLLFGEVRVILGALRGAGPLLAGAWGTAVLGIEPVFESYGN